MPPRNKFLGDVGFRIAVARIKKGLSVAELARRVGYSNPSISLIELGQRSPHPEKLVKIAHVLGVSTDHLLLGKETCACPDVSIPTEKDGSGSTTEATP